jgi:hypothetical protein
MSTRRARSRRAVPLVVIGVTVVLLALVAGRRDVEGPPLDPRSTRPLGTRGLVVLLEESGAAVSVSGELPGPDIGAALVLRDSLDEQRRAELAAWVRLGGLLVVADPLSDLVPPVESSTENPFDLGAATGHLPRECDLAMLREVRRLEPSGGVGFDLPREAGLAVPGATGCFPVGDGWFLVARPFGQGTVVAIGGAGAFVNAVIDDADNGALAVSLLAPQPDAHVRFLEPIGAGGGRATLTELIPGRVKNAVWQLAIGFGLYALWRGRRLGRPVEEPQPVAIPGSELVVAVGHLLQQAKRRDQAAAMLRLDLARSLSSRLGLPPDASPEAVAAAIATHTRFDADYIAALLHATPPDNDEQMLAVARSLESVRQEVLHAR